MLERRNNIIFIIGLLVIAVATFMSVRYHSIATLQSAPAAATTGFDLVDKKAVEEGIKSGNIVIHEAEYYRKD